MFTLSAMNGNDIRDIDYEKVDVSEYKKHYSERGFWAKIRGASKRAGDKLLYYAYLLYYVLISREVSVKSKGIICGALGYFILPTDLIPDFIVALGFTDDLAVLLLAYKTVSSAITPQIEQRAKERLLHSRKKDKKS